MVEIGVWDFSATGHPRRQQHDFLDTHTKEEAAAFPSGRGASLRLALKLQCLEDMSVQDQLQG